MNQQEYISYCGDICSLCPRYIATQKESDNELEAVAELWYKLGFRDTILSNEEIRCNGCNKGKICHYSISSCEHLNGKKNCGECNKFPCDKISVVFRKTEQYAINCRNKCTEKIYEQLHHAFFMKEEILTAINTAKFDQTESDY